MIQWNRRLIPVIMFLIFSSPFWLSAQHKARSKATFQFEINAISSGSSYKNVNLGPTFSIGFKRLRLGVCANFSIIPKTYLNKYVIVDGAMGGMFFIGYSPPTFKWENASLEVSCNVLLQKFANKHYFPVYDSLFGRIITVNNYESSYFEEAYIGLNYFYHINESFLIHTSLGLGMCRLNHLKSIYDVKTHTYIDSRKRIDRFSYLGILGIVYVFKSS